MYKAYVWLFYKIDMKTYMFVIAKEVYYENKNKNRSRGPAA